MTDETRPLDSTTIDRPSPAVIAGYAKLSPNELCDVLELSKLSLDDWERRHRAAVEAALKTKGYRL